MFSVKPVVLHKDFMLQIQVVYHYHCEKWVSPTLHRCNSVVAAQSFGKSYPIDCAIHFLGVVSQYLSVCIDAEAF